MAIAREVAAGQLGRAPRLERLFERGSRQEEDHSEVGVGGAQEIEAVFLRLRERALVGADRPAVVRLDANEPDERAPRLDGAVPARKHDLVDPQSGGPLVVEDPVGEPVLQLLGRLGVDVPPVVFPRVEADDVLRRSGVQLLADLRGHAVVRRSDEIVEPALFDDRGAVPQRAKRMQFHQIVASI